MFFGLNAIECYFAILVLFSAMFLIVPRRFCWIQMVIAVVLFSVLAYNLEPNPTDDLSRYFTQLDYLRDLGYDYLRRCIDDNVNGSNWGTFRVCGYYFYFMSKLPTNNWMPAITVFIGYGLSFSTIYKAANKFSVSRLYLYLACLFFLSTYWYYDIYSGIRNGLAFAVVTACAYEHLIERRFIPLCYVGYILASLMHSTGVMLVVLVLVAEFTVFINGKYINYLFIFGLIGGGTIMSYLSARSSNDFIDSVAERASSHQAGTGLYTDTNFLVNIAVMVAAAVIIYFFYVFILENNDGLLLKRFYSFSTFVIYFMIGCLYSPLIFMRLARWVLPVVGAVFLSIGLQSKKDFIENNDLSYVKFFAPTKLVMRVNLQMFVAVFIVIFSIVHLWYSLTGSSLIWMHFPEEVEDFIYEY